MLDLLTQPGYAPFTLAFAILFGLLLLELVLMAFGMTSHLDQGDAGIGDLGGDVAEIPDLPEASLAEIDLDPPDAGHAAPDGHGPVAGALRGLGLGDAPVIVWLAALAAAFAVAGVVLQYAAGAVLGRPLSGGLAALVAAGPALLAARGLSRTVARLLPPVESYGTSSFHRRRGVVTVGVARRDYPAEVRYADGFGTTHQLMAEPLDRDDEIPAGTEVVVLRDRAGKPRLIRIS